MAITISYDETKGWIISIINLLNIDHLITLKFFGGNYQRYNLMHGTFSHHTEILYDEHCFYYSNTKKGAKGISWQA